MKLMIKNFLAILILIFLLLNNSCDHGISPLPEQPEISGFEGTIFFVSPWPDSIRRTHLVIFKNPLLQPSDFVITNLKFISNEIPFGVQSFHFSSLDSAIIPPSPGPFEPGEYAYVAVAHQTTEQLSLARKDWFVSGVYYTNNDTTKPGVLVIQENKITRNVNIRVDFNNLPTQPPGG
ncbi:hypothetical protein [Ignavibacterium sp.]|uniref:hypothetical protein n=2 Tax=Ignavibacterium sp. TaxID=2651167 RepID=UPI00307EF525